jgi:hypothetical protein
MNAYEIESEMYEMMSGSDDAPQEQEEKTTDDE